MILVHYFGGLLSVAETDTVIDDYGTEHGMEELITMADPPLVIPVEAMRNAWRFVAEGADELAPLHRYIASLFYSDRYEWWQGDYHITVQAVCE